MRPATHRRPAFRTAAGLAALLAGFLAAPAVVEAAGCAAPHYLATLEAGSALAELDLLAALGTPGATDGSDPGTPAPTPCGSWRCQEAPTSPAPPTLHSPLRGEPWLIAADTRTRNLSRSERLAVEAGSPRPIRVPSSVFHPPR